MIRKKIIYGCESRGDGRSPYLTRYTLAEWRGWALYLHVFHRSDHDDAFHDHPWDFWTLILWRGYREYICETFTIAENNQFRSEKVSDTVRADVYFYGARTRRLLPGMIVYRDAHHSHRVGLFDEKPAATLVLRRPYSREWGFFTKGGWEHWRTYFDRLGC